MLKERRKQVLEDKEILFNVIEVDLVEFFEAQGRANEQSSRKGERIDCTTGPYCFCSLLCIVCSRNRAVNE
ncbi:hypothetical protein B0A55_04156 [Friedmanniomyces simplex]|uniref:Uncharacterized protein n=1 Tax=Friedmanniomyces simplex TaxID=329884 RepID=A0A4U0XWI3_9PEZI|nr:hypothetical protein B0A55_04156 [Friedmanniomyces simplex]